MMKNTFLIILFTTLIGCNFISKKKNTESDFPILIEKNKVKKNPHNDSLNGVWGLNNYFDSILSNKQIAKYRIQPATWFAILLEIRNDSLISYGSIVGLEQKLNFQSDTLTVFESIGRKYFLIKKHNELLLKQFPNEDIIDSTIYVFRKRTDLKNLLKNKNRVRKISDRITEYFNKHLISGTYIDTKNNEIIVFKENGELINFNGFDKYEIRNYFGTLHPHNNLDVITLINSSTNEFEQLNWKIFKDRLVFTEFVPEIVTRFGKKTPTDNYVLGKKKMELKIKEKH